MGHRSTPCTHQMLDLRLEEEEDLSYRLHPDQCISGNIVNFTNQSIHPVLSASANTALHGMMLEDSHDSRGTFMGNPYNSFQNFHGVPNVSLSAAAPLPSFYNPCILPSSSSRDFTPSWGNGTPDTGVIMDNQFIDNMRGFGKRKNAEVLPGFLQQNDAMAASSSSSSPSFPSLNCGMPRWDTPYEPVPILVDTTRFAQDRGNMQSTQVSSHRYVRSISNTAGIQPESAYFPHYSYVIQGTQMDQPLHPTSNVWMTQFGAGNNVGEMANSRWNYNHVITYLHGRWLGSGALEMTNMGTQALPHAPSSTSSGFIFNPTPSLPNFHQHLLVMQPMQVENYNHNTQIQAPYQFPLNNLHPISVNPPSEGLDSASRFPHFPSGAQQIHRPRLLHRASPDFSRGSMRIISSEDAAVMGISGIYEVNIVDQHQDMRLDIDQMSYEELLALQEQIGDVKTGLTEEYIIKNLKTSVHSPSTCLILENLTNVLQEAEACIICQVEYEKDDNVGTLNCGHNYHEGCIKQWLLMKNWCPVCKKIALDTDNNGR